MKYLLVSLVVFTAYGQPHRVKTASGNFIECDTLRPMFYVLRWGNAHFTRTYSDTIDSRYFEPELVGENKNVIIVKVSPANSVWYMVVLPLDKSSAPLRFDEAYAFSLSKNLIAYPITEEDYDIDTDTSLIVENWLTREKHFFVAENSRFYSTIPAFRIKNVEIRGDSIYYEWGFIDPAGGDSTDYQSTVAPLGF